jgi:hypothetical protein
VGPPGPPGADGINGTDGAPGPGTAPQLLTYFETYDFVVNLTIPGGLPISPLPSNATVTRLGNLCFLSLLINPEDFTPLAPAFGALELTPVELRFRPPIAIRFSSYYTSTTIGGPYFINGDLFANGTILMYPYNYFGNPTWPAGGQVSLSNQPIIYICG